MQAIEILKPGDHVTIEILVCTFRRPHLQRTLESLSARVLPHGVGIGVIVADNDEEPSAREIVKAISRDFPHSIQYIHAPARNISIARNACLAAAQAPWIAFLDDDELASPGWVASLWKAARSTGADAVFGPVIADYPPGTSRWIVQLDMHSTRPVSRCGTIETGYTGNALLRWRGMPWSDLRFEERRGTTGGEGTEFFFAAHRLGARYIFAPEATAHEVVPSDRLTFKWLARRRFWMGKAYVSSSTTLPKRLRLSFSAIGKLAVCILAAIATMPWTHRRSFWTLRGLLHLGVVAGCIAHQAHPDG